MQLGKFDSDRDSALHYLCTVEWSNDSTGDVEAPTGYVWRISLSPSELSYERDEIGSVLEEWFQSESVEDTAEFRRSLVGHFLVVEDSQGFVTVQEFNLGFMLQARFEQLQAHYEAWLDANEDV